MQPQPSPPATHSRWFRDDITGLRALAIIPVVAFHAGVPGFDGGFIGVDVFFVISGYLITTLLLREVDRHGRIRFAHFWARRIRRLAPASLVMIVATVVLGSLVVSPIDLTALAGQSLAAATYTANIVFALSPSGYFAEGLGVPNPFLHTWSLAVEEQFYLVWPIVIAAALLFSRGRSIRRRLGILFAVVALVSFAASVLLTPAHPSASFYLLPTRAWEFAVAGLLALVPARAIGPAWMRASMAATGLLVLVASTVAFSEHLDFPGWIAAVPVSATLLVITGGRGAPSLPSRLLSTAPLRVIGELSYSWYLWHWPFLVLMTEAWGAEPVVRAAAVALSLAVAYLSYRFVERPVRFHPRLSASVARTFAAGIAATLCVLLVSGFAFVSGERIRADNAEIIAARHADPEALCADSDTCRLGDPLGDRTILLFGDSHAAHWVEALDVAARGERIELVVRWRASCPAVAVQIVYSWGDLDPGCQGFRDDTDAFIRAQSPDALLISQSEGYLGQILDGSGAELSTAEQLDSWSAGYEALLSAHSDRSVGVVRDNPRFDQDPTGCLIVQGADACEVERVTATAPIAELGAIASDTLSTHPDVVEFSSIDLICDASACPVIEAGLPIFRDTNHLAPAWTLTRVPELRALLRELVAKRSEAS
ncbi:acyltransferase family protein [Agromyces sp. SYSU T00194]|uniref:acyltransferase family protein n=1 Tax=Agromyces chitinivorans TaxID=3158560 RepID=UPI0033984D42